MKPNTLIKLGFLLALINSVVLIKGKTYIDIKEIEFLLNRPSFPFPLPSLYYKIIAQFFSPPLAYKIAQGILVFVSTLTFTKISILVSSKIKNGPGIALLAILLFALSPWRLHIYSYDLRAHFTLTIFLVFIYFQLADSIILKKTTQVFLTVTSLPALIFAILKPLSKFQAFILFLSITLIVLNFSYFKIFYSQSYLSEISPNRLSGEINETIKVAYLGSAKEHPVPTLIQKVGLNKYFVFVDKLFAKTISFFDFERWASPLNAYSILSKSGLSPKGNWQGLFVWQLPLIVLGAALVKATKSTLFQINFSSFLTSIIVFVLFPREPILASAILLYPVFVLLTAYAISKTNSHTAIKVTLIILLISSLASTKYFYQNQKDFRYTHELFFAVAASLAKQNAGNYQQIIVTDRFGPTNLAAKYYLDGKIPENVKFQSFTPDENFTEGSLYIGLPGEFIGKVRKPADQEKFPETLEKVQTVQGWDAPVTEFGDELWLAKLK